MKNTNTATKPDVRTYLSAQQYLEDLYKFRKNTEESFSYETWAQELQFTHRSFLRQIVIGRRALTDATTDLLCERLNFDPAEKEYFKLLVHYSNSRNQDERNLYGRQLMQLLKSEYEQNEILNYYEFISNPMLPRLQTLLSFQDISRNEKSLQSLLGTSETQIAEALQTLEKAQLAERDEKNEWSSKKKSFRIPDSVGDVALLDYHAQSLTEAIAAKDLPKDQRRYKSLLVPLSPEEFQEYLKDLQEFSTKCLQKFDRDDLRGRRLYQINLNIHSVTEISEEI